MTGTAYVVKPCDMCGTPFHPKTRVQRFCRPACGNANDRSKFQRNAYGHSPSNHGGLCELITAVDLMRRGYIPFRNMVTNSPFDLVAYKDGVLLRVEVKNSYSNNGKVYAPSLHGRTHGADFDVLAIVADGVVTYEPSLECEP